MVSNIFKAKNVLVRKQFFSSLRPPKQKFKTFLWVCKLNKLTSATRKLRMHFLEKYVLDQEI
jgi:hypothetical protein